MAEPMVSERALQMVVLMKAVLMAEPMVPQKDTEKMVVLMAVMKVFLRAQWAMT
jgi:hypothetical protein